MTSRKLGVNSAFLRAENQRQDERLMKPIVLFFGLLLSSSILFGGESSEDMQQWAETDDVAVRGQPHDALTFDDEAFNEKDARFDCSIAASGR